MGRKLLYWDKLTTLLAEVEAILNTRPLTYVCEEFGSGFVLTPANFLISVTVVYTELGLLLLKSN